MEGYLLLGGVGAFLALILLFIVIVLYQILKDREGSYEMETYEFVDPKTGESHEFENINTPASKHLSVIIPAYNEEERIAVMLDETIEFLQQKQTTNPDYTWEMVITDDGSKDKTVEVVQKYVAKYGTDLIRVNKLKKNVGKGGAVRRAAIVSRGEYLLMADADGATRFSDLDKVEACMKEIEKDGNGVVVGSRAQYHDVESESERRPWYRNISHIVFAGLVDTLCVKGVKDTQCGFKLFTRASAKQIFLTLHIERWAFDVETLYIAQRKNFPVGEVIVEWAEIDGSHLSVISASLQMFKDILRVPCLYRLGYWKFA